MVSVVERFAKRFAGLTRAHGRYIPNKSASGPKNKVDGAASTVHQELTLELYAQHIAGTYGVGVVPIRDDSTCVFGSVDIDVYPLDLQKINSDIRKMQLPLLVARTKSGGAHLYMFTAEPGVPADLLREKLMNWAVVLGYGGVEVFPKQVKLASTSDFGNWINIPYFGGNDSNRFFIHPETGEALTVETFLDIVAEYIVDPNGLVNINPLIEQSAGLEDAPPCLQTLAVHGFPSGTRNNAMFNMAVYLKKAYPETWTEMVGEYNERFMSPSLGFRELDTITKSVAKKSYSYRCKEQPICNACNRTVCLTRLHGVKGANDDPGVAFGDLTKIMTDPPTWIWDVDGYRIELTTEELMRQDSFHMRCIAVINKWPVPVKPNTWHNIIDERVRRAVVVEVPPEATPQGQVLEWLGRFSTGRAVGRELEEILLGKPHTTVEPLPPGLPHDVVPGRTYFRLTDFIQYLKTQRVNGITEKKLTNYLRDMHAEHHFFHLKGKGVNVWSVPRFEVQTESFSVPRGLAETGEF